MKKTPGKEKRQRPDNFKKTLSLARLDSNVTSVVNFFPRTLETLPNWRVLASPPPISPLSFNPEIDFLVQIVAPATLENWKCAGTCPDTLLCESGSSVHRLSRFSGKQSRQECSEAPVMRRPKQQRGVAKVGRRAKSNADAPPPSRDWVRGKQNKKKKKRYVYF